MAALGPPRNNGVIAPTKSKRERIMTINSEHEQAIARLNKSGRLLGKSLLLAVSLGGALLLGPQLAMADSEGPFAGLSGSWHGAGRILSGDGKGEKIACRATYNVSPDGINLGQSLVCASDSYRFDIKTNIYTDGQTLRGTWAEATHNATGNLTGEVHPGLIESRVTAPGFAANVSVKTVGQKQIVSINPETKDIAQVNITMSR
jgi:hypothetical protein